MGSNIFLPRLESEQCPHVQKYPHFSKLIQPFSFSSLFRKMQGKSETENEIEN